jgi:hypothetical protein
MMLSLHRQRFNLAGRDNSQAASGRHHSVPNNALFTGPSRILLSWLGFVPVLRSNLLIGDHSSDIDNILTSLVSVDLIEASSIFFGAYSRRENLDDSDGVFWREFS